MYSNQKKYMWLVVLHTQSTLWQKSTLIHQPPRYYLWKYIISHIGYHPQSAGPWPAMWKHIFSICNFLLYTFFLYFSRGEFNIYVPHPSTKPYPLIHIRSDNILQVLYFNKDCSHYTVWDLVGETHLDSCLPLKNVAKGLEGPVSWTIKLVCDDWNENSVWPLVT